MTKKTFSKMELELNAVGKVLKLPAAVEDYYQQQENPDFALKSFGERVLHMFNSEQQARWRKRQQRNLKNAHLPHASMMVGLDKVDWNPDRKLNKSLLVDLCECHWLEHPGKPWVVISGATGVGKTWIAKLLTYEACMHGYTALYMRMPELIAEIEAAKSNHRIINFRKSLLNKQLLVIDEFGVVGMNDEVTAEFLTIIEQRFAERSLIIVGQIPLKLWHKHLGDPVKADAIMDRILYQSHRIEIAGKSQREKYGALAQIREAKRSSGKNSAEAAVSETSTGERHEEDI